jgi:hypothetical protein
LSGCLIKTKISFLFSERVLISNFVPKEFIRGLEAEVDLPAGVEVKVVVVGDPTRLRDLREVLGPETDRGAGHVMGEIHCHMINEVEIIDRERDLLKDGRGFRTIGDAEQIVEVREHHGERRRLVGIVINGDICSDSVGHEALNNNGSRRIPRRRMDEMAGSRPTINNIQVM